MCSFSSDKKHFLVPSPKSNSQSKHTSHSCYLVLLLPISVTLLLTGLVVEENKFDLYTLKWYYTLRDTGECVPFRDQTRFVTNTSNIYSAALRM